MHNQPLLKRTWVKGSAFVAAAALSLTLAAPAAQAVQLSGVQSAQVASDGYTVNVTFANDLKGKITFLDDGIFRYNVDPSGEFSAYAKPKSSKHTAKIQAQPDSSKKYAHPKATVNNNGANGTIEIKGGTTTIIFEKATGKMTVKSGGQVVMEEAEALTVDSKGTVQTLVKHEGEDFFGGGTQNGRFIHTGKSINIANESNWVDGGVASPNPFYWSDAGYGVLRNTFADGSYDFGKTDGASTVATHKENELDAYYFVTDAAKGKSTAPVAQKLLQEYFKVTGNPILMPEYSFYVGHLNAWNRDMWSSNNEKGYSKKQIKGSAPATDQNAGEIQYEKGGTGTSMQPNSHVESLNGHGPKIHNENIPQGTDFPKKFSAQHRLDSYVENDMPLGYFLPNDGYGAGYGQNGFGKTGGVNEDGTSSKERLDAVAANVENLKEFHDYAATKGVATGLWTQSYLSPDSNPGTQWQLLRDFKSEVKTGGVTTLKTDVAWVGPGYSMALDGTKTAYDIVTTEVNKRPNIITLDGWAGTQRFGAIWTGDQTGGNWEYIRFHVPTFIGQSLAGNPNVGSDNDGIFGGAPIITTRDYQWKSFAPLMLDMDGWGSYVKAPQTHGDPYTGISRMYLKLKSQLMPYIYTTAASAANIDTGNGDAGLPIVRAILLSDDSAYAQSTKTQYEYTLGEDFLVAPIYQNTADSKNTGDDVRNGIYLPGTEKDVWIDYFTGKQYKGGQVLNNFDAPLWKLPLFVRANAIVPMWEPNNSPDKVDRTVRNVEFFATEGENSYTLFEDTGTYIENKLDKSDEEYGAEGNISYGDHVSATFTSAVKGGNATFTAKKSKGTYKGYDSKRSTTFVVNVSEEPKEIVAKNGDTKLTVDKVTSQDAFDKAAPEAGHAVVFYNTKPNLNYGANTDNEKVKAEGFSKKEIITTPKLYVKFAKTDVNANAQTLELKGFKNDGKIAADTVLDAVKAPTFVAPTPENGLTPTSIKLGWNKVEGATGYEIMMDGMLNSIPSGETVEFTFDDLEYHSTHKFKIRTRTAEGVSKWSDELTVTTLEDPWRNVPTPASVDWKGGEKWGALANAFNHSYGDMFHSNDGTARNMPMTIDYGKVYSLDKFVYSPRKDNGGNGNVKVMQIETSLDGQHWTEPILTNWDNSGKDKLEDKTVDLSGKKARFLRLTVKESNGGMFSAAELALYKADGSVAHKPGSLKGTGEVLDDDYSHLKGNCLGRENRGTGVSDWNSHIASSGADFNMNNAYDVYDMSWTMSKLDGGTKQKGKVSGNIAVIPSTQHAKAGQTVTVDLYVNGAKNVNAMGALVHFNTDEFEFVNKSIAQNPFTASMEDLSSSATFGDKKDSVNIALANRGNKDLYNGTASVVSFQLKAKKDVDVSLESTAWLVGPTQDFVESTSQQGELPEAPQSSTAELGKDDFNITMTNKFLPEDDGSNAGKLLQNGSHYAPLFDGDESTGAFEFKWDTPQNQTQGKLPEYVTLPTTMHFQLKQPRELSTVEIFNRVSSNGSINSMKAVVTFEDGTTQEFKGGAFDKKAPVYTLEIKQGKKVKNVDITPLTSDGVANGYEGEAAKNHMLTLREINFNYTTPGVSAESVVLDKANAKTLYVDDLSVVNATVMPQDERYPYFNVESDNPEVASVVSQVSKTGKQTWFIRGNKAGQAKITVSAAVDAKVKATYTVEVKEGVSTTELQHAIDEAKKLDPSAYTKETYKALADAVKAGEDLIKGGNFSKQDVANAVVKINNAVKGLKFRPVNEKALINTKGYTEQPGDGGDVKIAWCESQAQESPATDSLDYKDDTFWHSNYGDNDVLPDSLVFDLGEEYSLTDVTFLPRQDGSTNGDIFKAQIFTGASVEELKAEDGGTLVGTFEFDHEGKSLLNRDQFKQMAFGAVNTRFVKVKVLSAGGDAMDKYASAAEFRFYGTSKNKPELTFPDVTDRTEHRDDIYWLARTGVTAGFPDGTFRPYASVTRCDMAAFLYRLVGEPAFEPTAEQKARFKDVDAETDHAKEIWWLAAQEISTGFGDGTFRPMDTVKRQDMAAFLHRLSQKYPAEKGARAAGFGFADVTADTAHAEDIAWLATNGVSEGWQLPGGGREFRGMSDVARGDMAAFLHRMDDKGLVHVE